MITLEKSVSSTVVNNTVEQSKVYNIIGDQNTMSLTSVELKELETLIHTILKNE